jgi:hypothetical protein
MSRKALLQELAHLTRVMVRGSLSSSTRTCGKPTCPCHTDPARRHGPNLYFTWREEAQARALYVPPEFADQARTAQAAWVRYWEIGCQLAALNREDLHKRWTRARRAGAARRSS